METINKYNKVNKESLLVLAAEQWAGLVLQQIEDKNNTIKQGLNEDKKYERNTDR